MDERSQSKRDAALKWAKRIGFWGILFFTVKGIITLGLFSALVAYLSSNQ